jgi:hypothetical protein
VYAPRVGDTFRHEMRDTDEFAVEGSPFRDSVEWKMVWDVTIGKNGDTYLYTRRLVQLGLDVNGAKVLTGSEIASQKAEIVQVMSHDGHVIDITGTENLTKAIASVARPENQSRIAQIFSPENLRALLGARAADAFGEVVGKPAVVGASWAASGDFGVLRSKKIVVDAAVGCGGRSCLELVRNWDVDQEQVADIARQHVAQFMSSTGGDPESVRLIDAKVSIQDTFVVEPDTCQFHDANLVQQENFTFEGPQKNRIAIVLTSKQLSHADYPPPGSMRVSMAHR